MSTLTRFQNYFLYTKSNWWYWLFSIFCRLSLAYAFLVAGGVKIFGERFASGLSEIHPMGAYLEALHHTGYYYTFIGVAQIVAAILLLIPRTVALGALLYFPIILNIWVLSFAVRFEGSFVTSPLMVLANLFLLAWHYDKFQYLLPFWKPPGIPVFTRPKKYSKKFPWKFFLAVLALSAGTVLFALFGLEVMPRNSLKDCQSQFTGRANELAGNDFCACIHKEGGSLDACLMRYEEALAK
ncbi:MULTISPECIES: hypothetical protein [Robiginitalea]|uniref:DoxX family protein n=1 Tax=Robiginitalea biformata (strain ATCC BAA-864 / DSM 15991 / KCTC 12146 / HTCC2501) TaxID=313596 RepID=A4CN02_ROBBH|nr:MULTISPECIES: hypothetical protein [Robiginitalea]EAR15044.1 hypothetical protein RB2501_11977 [Robiginitalea biformata HTCC2501]MDC6355140.1 DoxX family protein [Robiginitalea sp. PM2]MDC6375645.1 DoxX family protein [Robiginitalea sp. SP8]